MSSSAITPRSRPACRGSDLPEIERVPVERMAAAWARQVAWKGYAPADVAARISSDLGAESVAFLGCRDCGLESADPSRAWAAGVRQGSPPPRLAPRAACEPFSFVAAAAHLTAVDGIHAGWYTSPVRRRIETAVRLVRLVGERRRGPMTGIRLLAIARRDGTG